MPCSIGVIASDIRALAGVGQEIVRRPTVCWAMNKASTMSTWSSPFTSPHLAQTEHGVTVGDGVPGVGVEVAFPVGVEVAVAVGVVVGLGVRVDVAVAVGVAVGVSEGVDEGVLVLVDVAVGVTVGVWVGVSVGVGLGVLVGVGTSATVCRVTALAPTTTSKCTPGTLGNWVDVKFPVTVPLGAERRTKLFPMLGTNCPKRWTMSAPFTVAVEFVPVTCT